MPDARTDSNGDRKRRSRNEKLVAVCCPKMAGAGDPARAAPCQCQSQTRQAAFSPISGPPSLAAAFILWRLLRQARPAFDLDQNTHSAGGILRHRRGKRGASSCQRKPSSSLQGLFWRLQYSPRRWRGPISTRGVYARRARRIFMSLQSNSISAAPVGASFRFAGACSLQESPPVTPRRRGFVFE